VRAVTVGDMTDEIADLQQKLTKAYLAGDGASVVLIMEQLAEAEAREAQPSDPQPAAA
jgi:hypothetical protein